jgi:UDP-GlcNAc:undecaprenyl-phosphate GlcNAc-1-phosphate transferase
MNDYFILLSFCFLANFIFLYKLKKISKIINIYDIPDNDRKLHKNPVPLMGGVLLFINFLIIILFINFDIEFNDLNILLFSCLFFLVGLIDDKYNLLPKTKFLFNIIVLLLFFKINENFLIQKFEFYNLEINLNYYISFFFSILCVLIFINALNLFDGLNLQTLLYCSVTLLYLFYKDSNLKHVIIIVFVLICLMPFNYKNKLFLGDSGVYLLGGFLSLSVLDLHNINQKISAEEIFVIMMLPGLDMLRLFIYRLLNNKNPFYGDRNHIHHLLNDKYGYKYAIITLSFLIFAPILLLFFISTPIIIFLYLVCYFFIISRIYKKN